MKVSWEEKDLIAGRRYGYEGKTERWMIGYYPQMDVVKRACVVSLSDGMVGEPRTKAELVERLNLACAVPIELLAQE